MSSFEFCQEKIINHMRVSTSSQSEIIKELLAANKALQQAADVALEELKLFRKKAADSREASIA